MESVNFEQYEKSLAEAQFLGGQLPTNADSQAYELVKSSAPSAATHPNTFAWFVLVGRFSDAVRASWSAGQAAPAKGGDKKPAAKVEEVKKEEPKPETKPAAEEEDDMDLFGDDDDEEAKEALAAAKKKKEMEANAPKKKGIVIAKSIILFEVKPYEAETDLDALAKKILAIEMDGLVWKTEYKKEPIAYGVCKLIVGCVIEDDKIMTDDLVEAMEAFEEEVQSVDIACFNKV